jgi:hypothetical protein
MKKTRSGAVKVSKLVLRSLPVVIADIPDHNSSCVVIFSLSLADYHHRDDTPS